MPVPDVLLFGVDVVHLHLDVIILFSELKALQVNVEPFVAVATSSQAKGEKHVLTELLGDFIGFINQGLDLSRQLIDFNLISLLTLELSLFLHKVFLLFLNLPLVLLLFFLHCKAGQL